jgi:hypothetical protein
VCEEPLSGIFMVRTTAIAVLMLLALPLCLPLAQLKTESSLPSCCRRNGQHHCAAMARFRSSNQPQPTEPGFRSATHPCPYRSMLFATVASHGIAVPARSSSWVRLVAYPAVIVHTILQARISEARSHHKRGPPALAS